MVEVLLILLIVGSVVCSQIIELPGDVVVGGLFSMKKSVGGLCKDLDFSTIQEAEAVKWTFNMLNSEHYIKGVNIGFKAYDTCGVTEQALSMAKRHIADSSCSNSSKMFGVIGPKQSKEAISVSRLLGSLPKDLRLPQIGYATTSDKFSNREMFSNFFRVIPSNEDQIAAVLVLLEKLRWTYITIVYDEDLYGLEGVANIQKSAQQRGICIVKTMSIDTSKSSASLKNEMLTFLVDTSDRGVSGVVVLGSSRTTQLLIKTISSEDILRSIMVVAAEYTDPVVKLANTAHIKSILKIQPFMWRDSNFNKYWKNIFKGEMLLNESTTNPWLLDVFETITQCRPESMNVSSTSCPWMNDVEIDEELPPSIFTSYAIQSALVMAKSIKTLHKNKCRRYSSGPCKGFLSAMRSEMISIMDDLVVNFQADFGYYTAGHIFSSSSLQLQFAPNGNVETSKLVPSHEILNWRLCEIGINSFCFKPVGNYSVRSDELKLNATQVRQYKTNGDEVYWNSFSKAQCPDNTICSECIEENETNEFFYTKGDLYVVVIVPIHISSDNQITCEGFRVIGGFELSEAASYAIQSAKDQNLAIPQADIGVIVIDSCGNEFLIKERILSLHKRGLPVGNGEYVNVNDKILGYVGGLSSGVSSATAELLRNFGYVQISYASTSSELSDRTKYPYFLRVTTPDSIQVRVLLKIATELKSKYIQVIYSSGKYGEDGRDVILKVAAEFGVCITQHMSVEEGNVEHYRDIIRRLKHFPNSRVVILIMKSHVLEILMKEMDKMISRMEYLILGSESWGQRDFVQDLTNMEGAITLSASLPHNAGFLQHMGNIIPQPRGRNPWLLPYFTTILGCHYDWSFNKSAGHMCSGNERLNLHSGYKVDSWTPFLITAVQSLLRGAYETLKSLCDDSTSVCDAYRKNPMTLVAHLEEIQLNYKKQQKLTRVFNDNGDGLLGYTIWNVQKSTELEGKMVYESAGYAFTNGDLNLAKNKLVYAEDAADNSVCGSTNECEACTVGTSQSLQSTDCPLSSAFYVVCGIFVTIILILSLAVVFLLKRKIASHITGTHSTKDGGSMKSKSMTELIEIVDNTCYSDASSGYANKCMQSVSEIVLSTAKVCPRSTSIPRSITGNERNTFSSASRYRNTSISSMGVTNDRFVATGGDLHARKIRPYDDPTVVNVREYQNFDDTEIPTKDSDVPPGIDDKPVKSPCYGEMLSQTNKQQSEDVADLPDLSEKIQVNPESGIIRSNSRNDSLVQSNKLPKIPTEEGDEVFVIGIDKSTTVKSEYSDASNKNALSNDEPLTPPLRQMNATEQSTEEHSVLNEDNYWTPLPLPPVIKPPPIPTQPN